MARSAAVGLSGCRESISEREMGQHLGWGVGHARHSEQPAGVAVHPLHPLHPPLALHPQHRRTAAPIFRSPHRTWLSTAARCMSDAAPPAFPGRLLWLSRRCSSTPAARARRSTSPSRKTRTFCLVVLTRTSPSRIRKVGGTNPKVPLSLVKIVVCLVSLRLFTPLWKK